MYLLVISILFEDIKDGSKDDDDDDDEDDDDDDGDGCSALTVS